MNVGILDIETSMKPVLHPWQKGAYISTIGLRMHVDGKQYYGDWVWHHDSQSVFTSAHQSVSIFELQAQIDILRDTNGILVGHNIKFDLNWLRHAMTGRLCCSKWIRFIKAWL